MRGFLTTLGQVEVDASRAAITGFETVVSNAKTVSGIGFIWYITLHTLRHQQTTLMVCSNLYHTSSCIKIPGNCFISVSMVVGYHLVYDCCFYHPWACYVVLLHQISQ